MPSADDSLARTSPEPDGLAIGTALGATVTDTAGKTYLDFLAGIGVCNTGHRHPEILRAIGAQLDRHLHVMVFGEWRQDVQSAYAARLAGLSGIPDAKVYFANSGAEAVEGALKLARRATGRQRLVAFDRSYHGDTMGALSVLGVQHLRQPFAPLLPSVAFRPFGDDKGLLAVNGETAAVIVEPIQAEAGVRVPPDGFLKRLKARCAEVGALLIADEVQTGLGRTGTLWACAHDGVTPDVLVLAKALGGGLPLGAFIASAKLMDTLSVNPPLSHLTTFGGHPVSCAAGLAALEVTLTGDLPARAKALGDRIRDRLAPLVTAGKIAELRGRGLLIGVALPSAGAAAEAMQTCRRNGLIVGAALHDEAVLRLTPPLTLTDDEAERGAAILAEAMN